MSVMCSTDQGDRLKTAFESVRDFVNECGVTFGPDGIELLGWDRAHVVLVRYVLPARRVRDTGGTYEYNADAPVVVGIKSKVMASILKCSSPGDVVSLGVDPERVNNRLLFSCKNGAKVSRWEIVTPEVPEEDLNVAVEELKYSGSVAMSSALFHDMIRDLSTAEAATVKLACDGNKLTLSAEGLMARVSFEVADCRKPAQRAPKRKRKGSDEEDEDEEESEEEEADAKAASRATATFDRAPNGSWPVNESYAISHLQRIAKAKNICSRITIRVRPNFPAAFVYDSPIGTLTYIVASREDEDIVIPPTPNKPPPQKRPAMSEDD